MMTMGQQQHVPYNPVMFQQGTAEFRPHGLPGQFALHIHLLAKHKVLIRVMKGRRPHTNTSIIINCHRFGNLEAHLKKVQFKSSITSFFLTINVQLKGLEGGIHATK